MELNNKPPYSPDSAPKLGLVTNSIKEFDDAGKEHSEKNIRALFEALKNEGSISTDSIYYGKRIFGYHEAGVVAEEFAKATVDVILIFNSAFPNGYVFPLIAMNPYLQKIPIIIAADEEPNLSIGSYEWATNSVCGNDMNNYVAKYIGRYARFLGGTSERTQDPSQRLPYSQVSPSRLPGTLRRCPWRISLGIGGSAVVFQDLRDHGQHGGPAPGTRGLRQHGNRRDPR